MAVAGRKRKAGKRTKSGRLSRAGQCLFDRGTEHTQAMQDTARRIHNAYWQAYATGSYQCPLADRTHGSVVDLDHERIRRREAWLSDSLSFVRGMGPFVDRSFRRLCLDVHPDSGPDFLDRLCWATRQNLSVPGSDPDAKALRAALDALEQLAI
jgi:hypothetical protein